MASGYDDLTLSFPLHKNTTQQLQVSRLTCLQPRLKLSKTRQPTIEALTQMLTRLAQLQFCMSLLKRSIIFPIFDISSDAAFVRWCVVCFLFVLMVVQRQPSKQKESSQGWSGIDQRMGSHGAIAMSNGIRRQKRWRNGGNSGAMMTSDGELTMLSLLSASASTKKANSAAASQSTNK